MQCSGRYRLPKGLPPVPCDDQDVQLLLADQIVDRDCAGLKPRNTGEIDAKAGVLALPAAFTNEGTVLGGGRITSAQFTNQGVIKPGDGIGTLTLAGSLIGASTGKLSFEIESEASHDLLSITEGAPLRGSLELVCFADCSLAAGQSIRIIDAKAGALTGTFSSLSLIGFGDIGFTVVYDRVNGDVWLNSIQATVPEPSSVLLMLLGGGAGLIRAARRSRRGDGFNAT